MRFDQQTREGMRVNVKVSPGELKAALNADSEFRLQARYWDGALQLQFGDDVHVLRLAEGEIVDVDATPLSGTEPRAVIVSAPMADWFEFLQPIPRPLYHELYPAMWHHGFELKGDADYVWSYYAALRRSGEVLRKIAVIEEA
jgi:hypothetical protein